MNKSLQQQKIGLDDWACDQEVEYTLVAKVNDQVAYTNTASSLDEIEENLAQAEAEVAHLLHDQYIDSIYPEYWSNDDGFLGDV